MLTNMSAFCFAMELSHGGAMNDARIPEPICPLLQDYLELLSDRVPDLIAVCYLHGSIALDAFNERLSDIDFVTVLRQRPTSEHLTQLHK